MRLLLTLPLVALIFSGYPQGCSDAGFCTMGAMRPDQNYSKGIVIRLKSVELNYYRGTTPLSSLVFATTIELNLSIGQSSSLQVKLPYQTTKGKLGGLNGMGDISVGVTTNIKTYRNWRLNGTLGTKIPTNDANRMVTNDLTNGEPAPLHMYYQTSLGSYDAIAGISLINQKWLFATGIQAALTANKNQFLWGKFSRFPNQAYVRKYAIARNLKRGTDVMLRIERNFRFTNFNCSLGVLNIYRVIEDEGIPPMSIERAKIPGTMGLALSAIGSFGYQFDVKNSIKFIQGVKLIARDVNPDGLTRDEVTSISYVYKF